MALINNIYVQVVDESVDNDVESTNHPTETGLPLTDTVKKQPTTISISGKIVNTGNLTAAQIISKLKKLQKEGSLITYTGAAGVFKNLQIQNFPENYSNKNYGGADFSMTLREVKIAKSAYVEKTTVAAPVVSTPTELKVGNTVKFTGGNVYVSSDAAKPTATRGASTCTLTIISTLANAKHKYHLISKDCSWGSPNYVYGWVDAENIEGATTTLQSSSNGGTQQVKESEKNYISHNVKRGETIYKIVTAYNKKGHSFDMDKVIEDNPHAFSVKGMAHTLIVGAKLKLNK